MSALGQVVRSGTARRRVPSVVIGLAAAVAVAASIMGGSLVVASRGPFDDAFAAQHGAHLTAQFAADTPDADLADTTALPGVTAVTGPDPVGTVAVGIGDIPPLPLTIVGRDNPTPGVDDLTLLEGEWADEPGEIVLDDGVAPLGERVTLGTGPAATTAVVVGVARSVSRTAEAWTTPEQLTAVAGDSLGRQLLYRFDDATTAAAMTAHRDAIARTVGPDALTGSMSWLTVRGQSERDLVLLVPFLSAFGGLALVMSVLIVATVVSGSVGSSLRRIGVLKALGFTPGQVARAYLAQALIPAGIGAALGLIAGNLGAGQVLANAETAYGTTGLDTTWWVGPVVVLAVLAVVAAVALPAAGRAGRMSTVAVLATGRGTRPGRRRAVPNRLPPHLALGLTRPLARPGRALVLLVSVVFGGAAVTLGFGLAVSLGEIAAARDHTAADVVVGEPFVPGPMSPTLTSDPAAVLAAVDAQPGTAGRYAVGSTEVGVPGLSGSVSLFDFTGDPQWDGYRLVDGDWFTGPGETVAATGFLTATGTRIGDTVTIVDQEHPVRLRITGEVFQTRNDGRLLLTDAGSLAAAEPNRGPAAVRVDLTEGTDHERYLAGLNTALRPLGMTAEPAADGGGSDSILAINSLTALLTLLLVAVAGLGVFNGVVLDTREQVRALGIHRALGMPPRQVITMVLASVSVPGLLGGVLGVVAGIGLHHWAVPAMAAGTGLRLPVSAVEVYSVGPTILLGLGGLAIAVLAALLPAGWAARTRVATALRTE